MSFNKISVGSLNTMYTDLIFVDRATSEVIFGSVCSYSTTMSISFKELQTPSLHCYIPRLGTHRTVRNGYEYEIKKDGTSDYAHGIFYAKDKIEYLENGNEQIQIYIYSNTEEEFHDKLFSKISKYSSVPVLEEWKDYIVERLLIKNKVRAMYKFSNLKNDTSKCHRAMFDKDDIKSIVTEGLRRKDINISGNNNPSPILENITGLNDYLNTFGEILASKIQQSFKPKFIPGEDKYENYTNFADDFMYHEADIELFEAQKSVIQSVVNNLKVNDAAFIIAEMGSGKTSMGAAIPYVHNANKNKGFNAVVVCPSHLTIKWKREVEERIPNAKAYIVSDFNELKSLESKLRNKHKVENTYIILSKERAKMNYDLRPAAVWKNSIARESLSGKFIKGRGTFVCPVCGQVLYTKEYEGSGRHRTVHKIPFNKLSMSKKLVVNSTCMNEIEKWNKKEQKYETVKCNAPLWTPLNRDDQNHKWFKLGSEGWIYKEHIVPITEKLLEQKSVSRKDTNLLKRLIEQYNLIQNGEEPYTAYKGPKRYSIAKYIRERMQNVFDYCIIDEAHQAKGLSEQGQAVADLIGASKKSILLTGTLLNGYADGLYYLLWRTVPHIMRKEGFKFADEAEFARIYGVHSRERRYALVGGARDRQIGSVKEKRLPGVSPLVFTKFLLENAVFLSLTDMSNGLPGYEEIPVPVDMSTELYNAYQNFEAAFMQYARGRGSKKAIGPFVQALTTYPDCPHMVSPVIDPEDGSLIYMPEELSDIRREKEEALLDLVKEKIANNEKVLVYYTFVNKTDIGNRLMELFKDNDIKAYEMKSSVAPDKREEWVENHIKKGMQVMVCNPSLVETGLDLLDFTSIVFYQVGYNLFTMRQASRRSWRLSQTKDVKVYFMFYRTSIQEQTMSLMATKLQAAMAIEGKFSEEGLRAMSNNEDLLTQIANNVVEGIKDTVNQDIFKANAFIRSESLRHREHPILPSRLKLKMNNKGNKTIYSIEGLEEIPKRKSIVLNEDLLNNPIALFC